MSSNRISIAERAVESGAALCLGAAVAIAIFELVPLAGGYVALAALAGGMAAGVAAFALVASGPPRDFAMASFDPEAFADCQDELLLDEPIAAIEGEPAAMAQRIDDFLASGAGASRRSEPRNAIRPDASASLHAALAEIRRSLSRA